MLWFRSGEAVKRMALGYDAVVADLYWMRAVVYYGGQRLKTTATPNYDLLYSLLDLVTTLDPRFNIAYRFGAIFLAEAYPSGPGRPDQAVALLQRGIDRTGRWEYMHDIGFVYYWWLRDYPKAAEWFDRAAAVPGSPAWLKPLAATTLAVGGDRHSSRTMWQQLHDSSDTEWLRSNAEFRLMQLDAMDRLDALNAAAERYATGVGRVARVGRRWAPPWACARCRSIRPACRWSSAPRRGASDSRGIRRSTRSRTNRRRSRTLQRGRCRDPRHTAGAGGRPLRPAHRQLPQRRHPSAAARAVAGLAALDLSRLRLPHPSDSEHAGPVLAAARRQVPHLRRADLRPVSARGARDRRALPAGRVDHADGTPAGGATAARRDPDRAVRDRSPSSDPAQRHHLAGHRHWLPVQPGRATRVDEQPDRGSRLAAASCTPLPAVYYPCAARKASGWAT